MVRESRKFAIFGLEVNCHFKAEIATLVLICTIYILICEWCKLGPRLQLIIGLYVFVVGTEISNFFG